MRPAPSSGSYQRPGRAILTSASTASTLASTATASATSIDPAAVPPNAASSGSSAAPRLTAVILLKPLRKPAPHGRPPAAIADWRRPFARLRLLHPGLLVDVAVLETCRALVEDRFRPGVHTFGVSDGGVGWALDEYNRPLVSAEDEARMRERWPMVENGAHVKMHPEWRDVEAAVRNTRRLIEIATKVGRRVLVRELYFEGPSVPLLFGATLELQDGDFGWITAHLRAAADELCDGRLVAILEGGYDLEALGSAAGSHVEALTA